MDAVAHATRLLAEAVAAAADLAAADSGSTSNVTAAPTLSPAQAAQMAYLQALIAYMTSRIHTLLLFLLLGYGIMCALCLTLVGYLRFNRHVAFKGDADAARKIILPAFEPLLMFLAVVTGIYTTYFCTALATGLYTWKISKLATEVFYSGRQFVFLSVVVFMLQKSVSRPALIRTIGVTFMLATYTIPIVWYMVTYRPESELYAVLTASRSFMLLLYAYIFIRPPGRASKRTIREYCVFAYIYYALLYTYNELFRQGKLEPGFNLTYANLLCGSLCPLVIWRVLQADTEHWRGMGERAVALQRLFRQNNNLPERVSSKGLHVLIEMHRKYIIDFAYLELKQRIGTGASAVVFNGLLRSTIPVAVKVYTPTDFTEETVAAFSQETALCGALHHPNIVRFYGMCVCPPTICLVSELCQGSLDDVTRAMARRPQQTNRQQLLINLAYMIDAARAVAYLHSFTPAFLHRDIKPDNFLVDTDNVVKLTDFGESRSLRREAHEGPQSSSDLSNEHHAIDVDSAPSSGSAVAMESGANLQQVRSTTATTTSSVNSSHRMTVKGTVDYMAPEMINGKAGLATYGEAADVYSLGITMWDILNPGREKFPTTKNNHFRVFQFVVDGQRPELDDRLHPSLRAVIESAWQPEARLRPSAQNIVNILETIQEEMCAVFAMELSDELEDSAGAANGGKSVCPTDHSFVGERAIEIMQESQYVSSVSEGVRLGNALMDAGLMHHTKHARPFENTPSTYVFDEDNIKLCQPLAMGAYNGKDKLQQQEEAETLTTTSSKSRRTRITSGRQSSTHANALSDCFHTTDGSEQTLLENGLCACRKLGQRLKLPKETRSRRNKFRLKYKAIAEENVLQTSLLQDDHHQMNTMCDSNDLDEFDMLGATEEDLK